MTGRRIVVASPRTQKPRQLRLIFLQYLLDFKVHFVEQINRDSKGR
jgi:hypothetical protein